MHGWTVSIDFAGAATHGLRTVHGHALMVPLVTWIFQALHVSASLYDGKFWWPVHTAPSLVPLEIEHSVEMGRWKYNDRCFAQALTSKKTVLGEHAGHRDFFVPVIVDREVYAILVAGSFAVRRPTSADVLERWHGMTGRQGHPADPGFSVFLRAMLSTLVLEGDKVQVFQQLLECLAKLMAGDGKADELANRANVLRLELEPARFVDRVWEAARAMVDERSSEARYSAALAYDLRRMGLERAPDRVLVGLARTNAKNVDPVEEAVVRDAFQRGAVELARTAGDAIAGQVGDHGVVFLSAAKGSAQTKKRRLLSLGERASALAARRFGLALHLGASLGSGAEPLSRAYQDALGAAESALSSGKRVVITEPGARRSPHSLRSLRQELGRAVEEDPASLSAKFDRYLEAVAFASGYRIEPARAELELFLERTADTLVRSGALDPKSFDAMRDGLDRGASQAQTVNDLFAAYRGAAADMAAAVRNPVSVRQDRGLRGAIDYIDRHYAEQLALPKIARVAGFAPKYFSELFRKREKITFERYVLRLRVERAKRLLTGTDLSATRIAELSGLRTPQYLCCVFRRTVGATPLGYRASRSPEWTGKVGKPESAANDKRT